MKGRGMYISQVLFIAVCICSVQAVASAADPGQKYFRLAEKEYYASKYMYAIPLYKASLKAGKKETVVFHRLADCYWQIRNIDSALHYYNRYEEKSGGMMENLAKFRLAELLAQRVQYERAVAILGQIQDSTITGINKLVQTRKNGFFHSQKFTEDSLRYHIQYLNINSSQSDYSPQYYGQGIVYISNRVTSNPSTRETDWKGKTYSRLYQVKDASLLTGKDTIGSWRQPSYMKEANFNDDDTRPTSNDNNIFLKSPGRMSSENIPALYPSEPFANALNIDFNNGPVCFNKEGNVIYFTRNRTHKKDGVYNLEICSAVLTNGEWGQIKALPFAKEGYDYFHPALSTDGSRLYFCSNQTDGAGGADIYSVAVDYGEFAPMIINESSLNTAGNELFPSVHGDTLYFSSDGYEGLGGLDIYRSYRKNGVTQQPENLGYPVNSSYDDFGIVYAANNAEGLFTSNRLGSDDVYSFRVNTGYTTLTAKDSLERLHIAKIKREAEEAEAKRVADSISRKKKEELISVTPKKPVQVEEVEKQLKQQKLNVTEKKTQVELDNLARLVLFETAKDILLTESIRILEEVKAFMNKYPQYALMIEGHTDNRSGTDYNLDLSNRRAASVHKYLVSGGIAENRLYSKGYGLTRPIAPNGTPEGRQINRRVEMKIVKQNEE